MKLSKRLSSKIRPQFGNRVAKPEGWGNHWKNLALLNLKPAGKTVADLREESGE
jgi:hypothetical protein